MGPLTLEISRGLEDDRSVTDRGHLADELKAKSRSSVLAAELRCILGTLGLILSRVLAMPRHNVGAVVRFGDGSHSRIYRETAMRQPAGDDLVLIAVTFRLRLLGRSRFAHWLFRRESLLNTFLFAAHTGFHSKLWLTDLETGFYRGIYEWQGRDAAQEYAETLRVVLHPWVLNGSFDYRIIEGASRAEYLEGSPGSEAVRGDDGWWRPVSASRVLV